MTMETGAGARIEQTSADGKGESIISISQRSSCSGGARVWVETVCLWVMILFSSKSSLGGGSRTRTSHASRCANMLPGMSMGMHFSVVMWQGSKSRSDDKCLAS